MIAAFIFPRALVEAQQVQIAETPNNRVVTRPVRGWSGSLPASYVDTIREIPGVKHATGGAWAGFKLPGKDDVFFGSLGVNPRAFVDMHYEIVAPAEQKEAFVADDRGVMVSRPLAEEMGWKLGDRLVFESFVMKGRWEVNVVSIFDSTREGFAERDVYVGWPYLNRTLPADRRDRMSFISAEIFEPNQGGRIAKAIDARFASAQDQTLSLEDHVLAAANIGNFKAILDALDVISYLILAVIAAILGNTLAMSVRERTREFAVMRAIGFPPWQLSLMVLAEAALLGLVGAGLGLAISYPLFEGLVTRALQDAMRFPPIEIPTRVAALSLLLGAGLALISAGFPALRAGRLGVTESLARVG